MNQETTVLLFTAASIGLFHTLLGPDHYIPFIVMAKARSWSPARALTITFLCGLGHVASSVIIGIVGIMLGVGVNNLVGIESARGSIAAWMMIAFGLVYMVWGIRRSIRNREHAHLHHHHDGTTHAHNHSHRNEHTHPHAKKNYTELTPWILFTIFVFGPCEPFIPILLFPAANNHLADAVLVTLVFSTTTILTMMAVVTLSLYGITFLPKVNLQRHLHAIAGGTIFICGICIKFLGL